MPRDVDLRDQREQRDQLPVASIIALGGVAEVVRFPFRIDFFFILIFSETAYVASFEKLECYHVFLECSETILACG